jgi:hypothetical protein
VGGREEEVVWVCVGAGVGDFVWVDRKGWLIDCGLTRLMSDGKVV